MTTGDVAKGILIFCCCYSAFAILIQALTGQTALAAFMVLGFIIPLAMIIHVHMQDKKDRKKTFN